MGDLAPKFQLLNQDGENFDLISRKGHWTVLYFYPKSDTPGCTKQACAFRENIFQLREKGAEVYGISVNSVADQKKFHLQHKLNFDLLADSNGDVAKLYGTKMPLLNISKRWTFIIDPNLKVRSIDKDVDPTKDPTNVAQKLN